MTRDEFKDLALKRCKTRYPWVFESTWTNYRSIHLQSNGVSPARSKFGPGWIEINSNHEIIIGTHDDRLNGTVVWREWWPRAKDRWTPAGYIRDLEYRPYDGDYEPLPQPLYDELCEALRKEMALDLLSEI
jgi:hypothetical protein